MAKTVMVIASHPDDAELGMGGTIAALSADGHKVIVVDLTDGEPTPYGSPEIRRAEAQAAGSALKLTERITLDVKNREVTDSVENRSKVASLIRLHKPDLLFTHYWEDSHPDHVQATMLSDAARFYAKFVKTEMPHAPHFPRKVLYYFGIHLRPKVLPSFIFDISPHLDTKLASVGAYHSQFGPHTSNHAIPERLRLDAAYWGSQIGVQYGEPFVTREHVGIRSARGLFDV